MPYNRVKDESRVSITWQEVLIQVLIALVFFLGTSFGRDGAPLQWYRLVFLSNYLVAALVINHFLLPRFYYKQRYLMFAIGVILMMVVAVLVEELIIEKIFFPDTRGARFSSIFRNLIRMLPMLMLFVGFKFAWDAQYKQRELEKLRGAISHSQLQFLKSQINPHFLFNSLNNIYSYALEQSPKTPGIILELSSLLRYMLYECREEWVPLDKEIKYLNDFVQLQSLQIEHRGDINFDTQGDPAGLRIAPLILIVFVENCFKHSTASQSDKIVIDINMVVQEQKVHLKCKNSYTAAHNTTSLTKGIGLENVVTRLDLIYPERYQLDINTQDDLYIVDLVIDLAEMGSA